MIYADQRWIGPHGIGRFARYVLAGLDYRPVPIGGHPAAPLDAWRLARALRGLTREDLFFSPGYNSPLFCRSPFVLTIHDLSHIYCPENTSPLIQLYYATMMRRACRRAAKILTVSEFTRGQILEWSGEPAEKVVNVGCGVDASYRPEGESYRLPFPYLLCVTNRKPHKNEFRIVEAFAKCSVSPGVGLVFTGKPTGELAAHIERWRISSRVHFTGEIAEKTLPSLYRGALAVVFPSLYEGFGLPVLEGMACGTPVLTSNVTAMSETAGGAALLVDPKAVEEIAGAMKQVVEDAPLRQQLTEKGLARAATFSWDSTVTRVREIVTEYTSIRIMSKAADPDEPESLT